MHYINIFTATGSDFDRSFRRSFLPSIDSVQHLVILVDLSHFDAVKFIMGPEQAGDEDPAPRVCRKRVTSQIVQIINLLAARKKSGKTLKQLTIICRTLARVEQTPIGTFYVSCLHKADVQHLDYQGHPGGFWLSSEWEKLHGAVENATIRGFPLEYAEMMREALFGGGLGSGEDIRRNPDQMNRINMLDPAFVGTLPASDH